MTTRISKLRAGFQDRSESGDTLLGTFSGLKNAAGVEVAAVAGADWALVDLEHGLTDEQDAFDSIVTGAAYGVPVLVRVEDLNRIRVGRLLDAGAAGIMFPRIRSADDARRAVAFTRYPASGTRGAATYNRQSSFGLDPSAMSRADREISCVIQIETAEALAELDKIAEVEGVSSLFVGPVDLSFAVGTPMDLSSTEFADAVDLVLDVCERHRILPGVLAGNEAIAAKRIRQGFRLLAIGSDASVLAASLHDAFTTMRNANNESAQDHDN